MTDKTTAALKLAEEALEELHYSSGTVIAVTLYKHATAAIREALAEQENAAKMQADCTLAAVLAEREAIMDEWWMCVDSDLENGVKSLNERAAKKWHEEYPAISGFGEAIRARGEK